MSRDYRLYLDDIQDACKKVMRYTRHLNAEQFVDDEKTYDAVVRNLAIIGAADKHIPDEVRGRYSLIEWRKIGGLRDIVTHEYFGIDDEILWDVIQNQVPLLLEQVTEISTSEDEADKADE